MRLARQAAASLLETFPFLDLFSNIAMTGFAMLLMNDSCSSPWGTSSISRISSSKFLKDPGFWSLSDCRKLERPSLRLVISIPCVWESMPLPVDRRRINSMQLTNILYSVFTEFFDTTSLAVCLLFLDIMECWSVRSSFGHPWTACKGQINVAQLNTP